MRKYILLLIAAMFLVACGSNEEVETKEETEDVEQGLSEQDLQEDEYMHDDEYEEQSTDDPIEAVENDLVIFDQYDEAYTIKNLYTNDETTDNGFNEIDFEGYKIDYAIALVEDFEGEEVLGVFAEVENGTEHEVQFNESFLFATDTQDQTELEHGIQENKPNTKSKFFNHAPLEYDTPEELTVEIYPPFIEGESELVDLGKTVELEFTKE